MNQCGAFSALITFLLLLFCSCSPSIFSSDDKNEGMEGRLTYRQANPACAGLNLSSSAIDVPTFIGIVDCLNANGSINDLATFVRKLNENNRVGPVVALINKHIFSNKKLLYELDQTFSHLGDSGQLRGTFENIGDVISNDQLIAESIALLREAYFHPKIKRKALLKSIERLSLLVTPEHIYPLFDFLITVVDSPAFKQLQNLSRSKSNSASDTRFAISNALSYLLENDNSHLPIFRKISDSIANKEAFIILDKLLGLNPSSIQENVPRVSDLFRLLFDHDASLIDGISSLYYYLNRPVNCFKNSASIWNFDLNTVREVVTQGAGLSAQFYKKDNLFTILATNSFCDYPEELGKFYPAMMMLSDSGAAPLTTDITKIFYDSGMSRSFVNFLSDPSLKKAFPLLSLLSDKNIWTDFLYLLSVPDYALRTNVSELFSFFIANEISTDGIKKSSLYDVFADSIAVSDPEKLANFVEAVADFFVRLDNPASVLKGLRRAFFRNDAHPIVRIFQEVMAAAEENEAYFEALFQISQMPEFRDMIRMFGRMAKDGRLEEVADSLVSLFHESAMTGNYRNIVMTTEPMLFWHGRHNLSSKDLDRKIFTIKNYADPCYAINVAKPMYLYADQDFRTLIDCVGEYESKDLSRGLEYLYTARDNKGRFVDLIVGLHRRLNLDQDQMRHLIGALFDSSEEILNNFRGIEVKGLINSFSRPLTTTKHAFKELKMFVAGFLKSPAFVKLIKFLGEIDFEGGDRIESAGKTSAFSRDFYRSLSGLIEQYERGVDPTDRTIQLINEYDTSVNAWELINGKQRSSWNTDELRKYTSPLFAKFGEPRQSSSEQSVLTSLSNFLQKVANDGDLTKWIIDRSDDVRPILYFYPGESCPKVKLVNTLDRFELLMINGDFRFMIDTNFGLQFLDLIANAWGDEPRDLWPERIKQRYRNSYPLTLKEAAEKISETLKVTTDLIGFPTVDKNCGEFPRSTGAIGVAPFWLRARVFNLEQLISVMNENLPDGLRILRRLFYEISASTPGSERGADRGWKNNLSIVPLIAKIGLMRQIGIGVRSKTVQEVRDFTEALVLAGSSEPMPAFLRHVFPGTTSLISEQVIDALIKNPKIAELVFYTVAESKKLGLTDFGLAAVSRLLQKKKYGERDIGPLISFLSSINISPSVRAIYRHQGNDEAFRELVREFLLKPDLLTDLVSVLEAATLGFTETELFAAKRQKEGLAKLLTQEGEPDTGRALRTYIGDLMASEDFDRLVMFLSQDPALLEIFSKFVQDGSMSRFVQAGRRGFQGTANDF